MRRSQPFLDRPVEQLDPVEPRSCMIGITSCRSASTFPIASSSTKRSICASASARRTAHKYVNAVLDRRRRELRAAEQRLETSSAKRPSAVTLLDRMESRVLGEFDIIARYFARARRRARRIARHRRRCRGADVRAGRKLVVAIDTIVEGVHFRRSIDAERHRLSRARRESQRSRRDGRRARVDDACRCRCRERTSAWLEAFAAGLFELAERIRRRAGRRRHGARSARRHGRRSPAGSSADRWLTRSGAQPGDLLYVSGIPGEAAAGLAVLQQHGS